VERREKLFLKPTAGNYFDVCAVFYAVGDEVRFTREVIMSRTSRWQLSFFVLVLVVSSVAAGAQAVPKPEPVAVTAPVPPVLLAAKKIFLSNAGADSGLFPHPFSGTRDRAYDQFYAAVKDWGHYDLVSNPADADLVLELQLTAPNGPTSANKQNGASDPLPMFRLVIFDCKTHYILWALTESIDAANFQKTHDYNFDEALTALLTDLKSVVTPSPAPAP
jgi:hypothetical protein